MINAFLAGVLPYPWILAVNFYTTPHSTIKYYVAGRSGFEFSFQLEITMKSLALVVASMFAAGLAFAQAPAKKEEAKKDAPKAEAKKDDKKAAPAAPAKAEAKKDEKKPEAKK
jgi:uncharacterized protein (DUF2147 family)